METVIPALDKRVLIVNGGYRGAKARLLSINETKFAVSVKIEDGPYAGTVLDAVAYEDVCKVA